MIMINDHRLRAFAQHRPAAGKFLCTMLVVRSREGATGGMDFAALLRLSRTREVIRALHAL